jgi:hypothetical protein
LRLEAIARFDAIYKRGEAMLAKETENFRRAYDLMNELAAIFQSGASVDREVSRINSEAATISGEFRRLRTVELTARDLEQFTGERPSLMAREQARQAEHFRAYQTTRGTYQQRGARAIHWKEIGNMDYRLGQQRRGQISPIRPPCWLRDAAHGSGLIIRTLVGRLGRVHSPRAIPLLCQSQRSSAHVARPVGSVVRPNNSRQLAAGGLLHQRGEQTTIVT